MSTGRTCTVQMWWRAQSAVIKKKFENHCYSTPTIYNIVRVSYDWERYTFFTGWLRTIKIHKKLTNDPKKNHYNMIVNEFTSNVAIFNFFLDYRTVQNVVFVGRTVDFRVSHGHNVNRNQFQKIICIFLKQIVIWVQRKTMYG